MTTHWNVRSGTDFVCVFWLYTFPPALPTMSMSTTSKRCPRHTILGDSKGLQPDECEAHLKFSRRWVICRSFSSGWWFGTWLLFCPIVGNFITPTDELHHFSEGFKPPTRLRFSCVFHIIYLIVILRVVLSLVICETSWRCGESRVPRPSPRQRRGFTSASMQYMMYRLYRAMISNHQLKITDIPLVIYQ